MGVETRCSTPGKACIEESASPSSSSSGISDQDLCNTGGLARRVPECFVNHRQTPSPGVEMWRLDDLVAVEGARPCIVHGLCTLCTRQVDPTSWGNPGCRGCSIVDILPFEKHPFGALLKHNLDGVQNVTIQ